MRRSPLHHRVRDLLVDPLRAQLTRLEGVTRRLHLAQLSADPRYDDARCLVRHGYRCFSQNDEDGMIDEIFRRVGAGGRRFVEFGVETGVENNTLALLTAGWSGLWIEGDPGAQEAIRRGFADPLSAGRLRLEGAYVTAENVERLFSAAAVPEDLDLLAIDIDGNDYWVWRAIRRCRPRVVVIEYNASLGRTARLAQPYQPASRWDGTSAFGASLAALAALGREKGYALVGCDLMGVNAFFVRDDLVGERFLAPFTAERHFEPPRFGATGAGHPPRWSRFEEV